MNDNQPPYPAQACADCLEDASRQADGPQHRLAFDRCGACGKKKAVTDPANFGSPVFKQQEVIA